MKSLERLLKRLAAGGCRPCISYRGETPDGCPMWRAHVNACGNFWEDETTPYRALCRAEAAWLAAGKPLEGMAATAEPAPEPKPEPKPDAPTAVEIDMRTKLLHYERYCRDRARQLLAVAKPDATPDPQTLNSFGLLMDAIQRAIEDRQAPTDAEPKPEPTIAQLFAIVRRWCDAAPDEIRKIAILRNGARLIGPHPDWHEVTDSPELLMEWLAAEATPAPKPELTPADIIAAARERVSYLRRIAAISEQDANSMLAGLALADPAMLAEREQPEGKGGVMNQKPLEDCCVCDEATGRAGRGDDSIYCNCGAGPFCVDCWRGHACEWKDDDSEQPEEPSNG